MAYPRQLTVEKILETGIRMLKTSNEVGLRPLARELGVKAPSLYRYMRSKQDLEKLLAVEGYHRMGQAINAALRKEATVSSMARAYRNFALSYPRLYHLMHRPGYEPEEQSDITVEALQPLADHLGMKQNDEDFITTFRALRAYVHGFISLELAGQFTRPGNVAQAFEHGLSLIAQSLKKN